MALNTSKCNHLTPLPFKGLTCHVLYSADLSHLLLCITRSDILMWHVICHGGMTSWRLRFIDWLTLIAIAGNGCSSPYRVTLPVAFLISGLPRHIIRRVATGKLSLYISRPLLLLLRSLDGSAAIFPGRSVRREPIVVSLTSHIGCSLYRRNHRRRRR